jgi:hypothetical protein
MRISSFRLECEQEIKCFICIFCVFCCANILGNDVVYYIVYNDKLPVGEDSYSILVKGTVSRVFRLQIFQELNFAPYHLLRAI